MLLPALKKIVDSSKIAKGVIYILINALLVRKSCKEHQPREARKEQEEEEAS